MSQGERDATDLSRLEAEGLRPVQSGDAAELYALIEANRAYLAEWMPWPADQTLAGTEEFIAGSEAQLAANDGFQAVLVPEGAIVGVIGFHGVDWMNRRATIGYWLAEAAQGKGLMTNAVRALLDFAFGEWDLHRVEIQAAPGNRRSCAIAERLGFREEGRLREAGRVGDRYLDLVVYGLLQREWQR
jgi:ribosomal-protein-serine acetyltransferase